MWQGKYRARKLDEIYGQDEAIFLLKKFITNFGKGKKAVLLYGPTGSGKSVIPYSIASYFGLEIFEINASDFRSKEKINSILKQAAEQKSLFAKGKLLFVDEIDCMTREDIGGIEALTRLIEKSSFPIILTANDPFDKKLSLLRQKCELVELKKLRCKDIFKILKNICEREKIKISKELLLKISARAKGDARAAINDLQVISMSKTDFAGERDDEKNIFEIMEKIFSGKKLFDVDIDIDMDEILLWLDENLPYIYEGKQLARAYEILSKIDVFRGRIRRQQYWRLLFYQNLLLAGMEKPKKATSSGYACYRKPSRILKIWTLKQRLARKKNIAENIAKATHTSTKKVLKDFPLFEMILEKEKEFEMFYPTTS